MLEDYQFLKDKYNTLKDKEKSFQNKYKGIINLFNEALEDLLKDEEIKNKENIYININELNKGNYEQFTKEEKYSILIVLINKLLPLIKINEKEKNLNELKDKINNIEFKMNKTQMTKFSDSSRCQTVSEPFLRINSNNFYNISTNNESHINNSNEKKQFVSLFGDDYIQYGKSIFNENKNIKDDKINYEKMWKKKKIRKSDNLRLNNGYKSLGKFLRIKTCADNNNNKEDKFEIFKKKIEKSSSEKKDYKNSIFKRGKTFDRKLVRVMIVK